MKLKIGEKPPAPTGLVPTKVKWKIKDGKIIDHGREEKTIRALAKALGSLLPKRGEGGGYQHFVKGPHIFLASCSETRSGTSASYRAVGRALIGRTHMPSDTFSEDVYTFDLTFKDALDKNDLPEIEIITGEINPLPRGARLTP